MTEHYWTPQSNVSNETSTNKTFQRTISAQVHICAEMLQTSMTLPPTVPLTHLLAHIVCFSPLLSVKFTTIVCVWNLQDTLAYATALLNEKEQSGSSNGSDGSPANENADRSLRQVAIISSSALHNSGV